MFVVIFCLLLVVMCLFFVIHQPFVFLVICCLFGIILHLLMISVTFTQRLFNSQLHMRYFNVVTGWGGFHFTASYFIVTCSRKYNISLILKEVQRRHGNTQVKYNLVKMCFRRRLWPRGSSCVCFARGVIAVSPTLTTECENRCDRKHKMTI